MALGIRKLIMLTLVVALFVLANAWLLVSWLEDRGVIDLAKHVRAEYLTGTAITIIIALLILLVGPKANGRSPLRRCPVCDHRILGRANYCGECGSKA